MAIRMTLCRELSAIMAIRMIPLPGIECHHGDPDDFLPGIECHHGGCNEATRGHAPETRAHVLKSLHVHPPNGWPPRLDITIFES